MAESGLAAPRPRSRGVKGTEVTQPDASEPGYDDPMTSGGDPVDADSAGRAESDAVPAPAAGSKPRNGRFRTPAVPSHAGEGLPGDPIGGPAKRLTRAFRRLFGVNDR